LDASAAELVRGWFMGLAIDEENQGEMTEQRIEEWVSQIMAEFSLTTEKGAIV